MRFHAVTLALALLVPGFAQSQSRRVDAMLVNVRRELSAQGMELVNVRSRGWMVAEQPKTAVSA